MIKTYLRDVNDRLIYTLDGLVWQVEVADGAWMPDSPIPVGWDERDAKGV